MRKTDAGQTFEYAGTHGNCDVTNCIGTPKDRANFGATWDYNAFSVSAIVNWRNSFQNMAFRGDACANTLADGTPAPSIAASILLHGRPVGALEPDRGLADVRIVANVTDRIAPLDPLTYGAINYNPLDSSGAIGRYYTIGREVHVQVSENPPSPALGWRCTGTSQGALSSPVRCRPRQAAKAQGIAIGPFANGRDEGSLIGGSNCRAVVMRWPRHAKSGNGSDGRKLLADTCGWPRSRDRRVVLV